MAQYSFWVLGESNLSFTGGVTLDGITQGDGSHLVGEFMTINSINQDFITIDDGGTDTNFSDNDGDQRLDGAQVIDGITYADNTRIEAEFEFTAVDDATGIEYRIIAVNVVNSSPAFGTNEAIAFVGATPPTGVALRITSALEGPPNTGGRAVDAGDIDPICLTVGTRIETDRGPVAVERLQPGDRVATLDGTFRPLRRVFRSHFSGADLRRRPKLRPVRIVAGAMGLGLPQRDLLVSRQHRMLISSRIAERVSGEPEVLVAAIRLTELPGIFVDEAAQGVTYFHLLFDRHEVIFAEGAPTESLFTGPEALKAIPAAAREELLAICPDILTGGHAPEPAQAIPTGKLQKQLVARHLKNGKAPLDRYAGPTAA